MQTLPSLLSGELYPSDVRSALKGFTRSVTCIFIMLPLYLFPVIEESLQLHGTFFAFAGALLFAFPLVFILLPETKDLRLEEIQGHKELQLIGEFQLVFYISIRFLINHCYQTKICHIQVPHLAELLTFSRHISYDPVRNMANIP